MSSAGKKILKLLFYLMGNDRLSGKQVVHVSQARCQITRINLFPAHLMSFLIRKKNGKNNKQNCLYIYMYMCNLMLMV